MSEQEDSSRHKVTGESSVVVVKQQAADRIKSYRSTELENEQGERPKWSKTPVVPSVAEEFKEGAQNIQSTAADTKHGEKPERKKQEHVSTAPRGQVSKILSAMVPAPNEMKATETIALTDLQKDPVLKVIPSPAAPFDLKPVPSGDSVEAGKAKAHADEDSITEEIAELPTTAADKSSEWSDEQEAGGLPRSESRTTRVSRVVRHFLCCSAVYSPASEDDISTMRLGSGI